MNINGVPRSGFSVKQRQLHKWWKKEDVGIVMLAEVNTFWPAVSLGQQWDSRLRKAESKGHHSAVAFNTHLPPSGSSSHQHGGCLTSVLNQVSHAVKSSGADPTGLGRWSWVKLRGRKKHSSSGVMGSNVRDLVLISAYRPNPPGKGPATVWAQHRTYLDREERNEDPREAFMIDLLKQLRAWRDKGTEIILGVDANEDLTVNSPSSFRSRLREIGLVDAVQWRHRDPPPATHQANSKNQPIDGIFVSDGVPIKQCGYYPFGHFVHSDHRALWIDFDLHSTLGGFRPAKSSFQPRRLALMDKAAVKRYIQISEQGYYHYDIPNRLMAMQQDLALQNGTITPRQAKSFNCLHEQCYMIRRIAEKHCRKLHMGGVPWSPVAQDAWDRLRLWKMLLLTFKGVRVSSRKLRRLMYKTKLLNAWKMSEIDVQEALRKEREKYKHTIKPKAWDLRRQFITVQTKATEKAKQKNKAARERYHRWRSARQREETRRRRKAQGKGYTGGLREIQVERKQPNGSVETVTLTDQRLVEDGCMKENQERYNQTLHPFPTPPMTEPLYTEFTGPKAESNFQLLLRGRYTPPPSARLDQATKLFLQCCRVPDECEPMPLQITRDDHIEFWSKNPENKGSEPHGLHNGHFKAGVLSSLLASCDSVIRQIPWSTGFSPAQWKHLMNFAIEKKPGELRVKKMRTIQMMNSELQANNKKIGRSAMQYAEHHKLIPEGQHGSRKQRQAEDAALSKVNEWDEMRCQRRAAGWISNDAKSCFDRVVHWVGWIALLRFGIGYNALKSMFETLMTATHRVRTGFGDSLRSFSPPSRIPFQGCGQGNGAGPTIWVACSSIIIDAMDRMGFGYIRRTAISLIQILSSCFSFVDDTDLVQAAKSVEESGENIVSSIQECLTLWAGLVRSTGGAINPEKSFWWMIDFKWVPSTGCWKFRRKNEMPGSLSLIGLSNQMESLTRKEPNEPERTLGVIISPEYNPAPQLQHMLDQSKKWSQRIPGSSLLQYDVFPLLKTTIIKSLEYPMAITTFSHKVLAKLMSPILQVCLPKAGVCRSFPRAVIFGPLKFQGMGIPHPYGLQVCRHIDSLLRHSANQTGTWLRINAVLEAHQLETGTSFGLFQQAYDNTAILATDTWLKRVWHEFEGLDIHLEFNAEELEFCREGDRLLMDLFIDMEVDQQTLLWLNWCRQYLHATTLSDIVSADGKSITLDAWNGIRSTHYRDRYNWPRTVRPTEPRWRIWRETLSDLLVLSSVGDLRLRQPLGMWTDSRARWNWLFSSSEQTLFHRLNDETWEIFNPANTRTRVQSRTFRSTRTSCKQPHLPHHRGWIPDEIRIIGDEDELVRALFSGTLRVIGDGSYKAGFGSAAVQLTTFTGTSTIWLRCRTPGLRDDQSAYRSELAGLYAGLLGCSWLYEKGKQMGLSTEAGAEIACDGLSALRNSFSDKPLQATQRQFDLLSSIREQRRLLPIKWLKRHVDGHADRQKKNHTLSWWELRNIECDKEAQAYRRLVESSDEEDAPNPRFFTEPAALFIHGVKQSRLDRSAIMELVTLPPLKEYWVSRNRISPTQFDLIDWDAVHRCMTSLPFGLQKWTTKHTVGMCGVGKFRQRWGLDPTDQCPRCGKPEDHLHVPRCEAPGVAEIWTREMQALRTWMLTAHTDPLIIDAILGILEEVRQPDSFQPPSYFSNPSLSRAIHDQRLIGAQGLLEGLLASKWRSHQQRFLSNNDRRNSVSLWASRLSQQLILVGFHLWEHRNGIQHSPDNVQTKATSDEVDANIHEQYDMGMVDLPASPRRLLQRPISEVLALPLAERSNWVSLLVGARRRHRRSLRAQRQMIYDLTHGRHTSSTLTASSPAPC